MKNVAKTKEKKGFLIDAADMFKDPGLTILISLVFLTFLVFIIYPFSKLIFLPTLADWKTAFTSNKVFQAFWHTMASSLLATVTAIVMGFSFAYAMNYTNIPGKKFFRVLALLPNMAPSVMTGLSFLLLFGRRGVITYRIFRLHFDPYGWFGLWIVQSIAFFPLAYITISGVLKSISSNVELSAQNLGASGLRLFRTVTLPLAIPGIASAFLLVFINALADFGNPKLVGGNYGTLATLAYTTVTGNYDMPLAAALSLFLVAPSLLVFILQKYFLDRRSYVTVTGKPSGRLVRDVVSLPVKVVLFVICSVISLMIMLLIGGVVGFSFTETFGVNNTFVLKHFYSNVITSKTMGNSWHLSLVAAAVTASIGVMLGYLVNRKRFPGRGLADFLAMLPACLPGTFIGLALLISFNSPPLMLTSSAAIIVIGMTIRQIPVGYRNAVAGFKQIDKSIEEAAANLGSGSVHTFVTIVMPMLKNPLSICLVYSFMKCMNTLSTVIFLVSPRWNLASNSILNLADFGSYGGAAATALGMMLIILITFGIAKLLLKDKINIFDL
ncbi:iron(III) dicitrate transport ATP-binding protein FecE [Treponema primitia ZAS-2]|uniref:Iron(III) dicitrate transport ATP-binding protein FecE n=1 Tax=Treponema primitia (strain ATCC BAA-887 / DSM 12427 / ZAS-2) TaxID=545694 RepID=F5YK28_TREPZ|nr:iron ABC transporter permease [Treponema primitia]AEF83644.1 iron(III) dicitrate transport ATP-binding protein FecE [Treponema primitia ZAS-2]